MTDRQNPDVAAHLALLRERFSARATTELAALADAVANIQQAPDSDALNTVYHLLHRLAGSAGTFGFTQLGAQARVLEQRLKPVAEAGDKPDAKAVRKVINSDFVARVAKLPDLLSVDPLNGANGPSAVTEERDASLSGHNQILLLEPDEALAELMVSSLNHFGYRVTRLADCETLALNVSAQLGDADLVVLDFSLLDAFAQILAGCAETLRLPYVVLSYDDSFALRYRAAELGAGGFFPRPVDIPLLVDRVEQLIGEYHQQTSGRVLVVDDDRELAEHYALVLQSGGMDACAVTDPYDLLPRLHEFRPDIVFMDLRMGAVSGMALARMIRFQPEWMSLPIIYLSSEQDSEEQLNALAQGADDFVTKPISDGFLLRSARVRCARARQLAKLVSRDSLTGLLKHSYVKLAAEQAYARIRRGQGEAVFAMVDLDHFKRVNDTYGHAMGDLVIKSLANLLKQRLRKTDTIGRYGGEEFAVILQDCGLSQAMELLDDVRRHFDELVFSHEGQEFHVTLSMGVASMGGFASCDRVMKAADDALYEAKAQGRDRVVAARDDKAP